MDRGPAEEILLIAENVHKVYEGPQGGVTALCTVTLSASRGEFITLARALWLRKINALAYSRCDG